MKKALQFALLLSIIAIMAVGFTACRSDDTELRVMWWGGDFRAELTHGVIDMFLEASDDVAYVEATFHAWGDYWTEIGVLAAGGDLPDVMQHDVAHVWSHVDAGLLMDLRPFIESGAIDVSNIPQAIWEAGMVPGHGTGIYAIPLGMNVAAMVYNASLIDELGLSNLVRHNMTLDDMIAAAREIYARSGVRTNWIGTDPRNLMDAHLRAQGVSQFGPDGLGGTWEHYVDYFRTIQLGLDEGWHIRPEHLAGREGAEQNAMWYPPGDENANLRAWNSMVWSNMVMGYVNDSPEGMEIRMTTYPSRNPQVANFGRASMFFSITNHSENPDEAAAFINFFLNNMNANRLMMGERGVIVNDNIRNTLYPELPFAAQFQADLVAFVNSPGNSTPFSAFIPDGGPEVIARLVDITDEMARGYITPEEAAQMYFEFGNNTIRARR